MNTAETARPFWRQGDIYFVKLDQGPDTQGGYGCETGHLEGRQVGRNSYSTGVSQSHLPFHAKNLLPTGQSRSRDGKGSLRVHTPGP